MGLSLHFIKNNATGDWLGIHDGLEEGPFEDAHPFTSLGQAMDLRGHLEREARRTLNRVIGFAARRAADDYAIVTIVLRAGGEDDETQFHGQVAHARPDDADEPEPDEDDGFEDDEDRFGGGELMRRVRRRLAAYPSTWPRIWTRTPVKKAA